MLPLLHANVLLADGFDVLTLYLSDKSFFLSNSIYMISNTIKQFNIHLHVSMCTSLCTCCSYIRRLVHVTNHSTCCFPFKLKNKIIIVEDTVGGFQRHKNSIDSQTLSSCSWPSSEPSDERGFIQFE